jgi:hypothetical protein
MAMIRRATGKISSYTKTTGEEVENVRTGKTIEVVNLEDEVIQVIEEEKASVKETKETK